MIVNRILPKMEMPNLFIMYFIANCAFTELPELSKGGAKAEMPKCPGMIPITPPPTPVLAGIPEVYNQSPVRS